MSTLVSCPSGFWTWMSKWGLRVELLMLNPAPPPKLLPTVIVAVNFVFVTVLTTAVTAEGDWGLIAVAPAPVL